MRRGTKLVATDPKHERLYQDLNRLFAKHLSHMDAIEMLAVVANLTGKMIALQDQRKYTPTAVMNLVARNIEEGNQQAIDSLVNTAPAGRG